MKWRNVFCTVSGQFEWRVFPLPNFEKRRVKIPSHYNHLYVPAKRHVLFPTGFIFAAKFAVSQLNSLLCPSARRTDYYYKNRRISTPTFYCCCHLACLQLDTRNRLQRQVLDPNYLLT